MFEKYYQIDFKKAFQCVLLTINNDRLVEAKCTVQIIRGFVSPHTF